MQTGIVGFLIVLQIGAKETILLFLTFAAQTTQYSSVRSMPAHTCICTIMYGTIYMLCEENVIPTKFIQAETIACFLDAVLGGWMSPIISALKNIWLKQLQGVNTICVCACTCPVLMQILVWVYIHTVVVSFDSSTPIYAGFSGLVSLDQSPKEYRKLKDQFSDKWCKGRGQQPQIIAIYKIVNPSLERRFKEYSTLITSSSSLWYKSEEYYHGTPLTCNLPEYSQPCSDTKCGVCGITKRGFDPERISKNGLLTFGKGFYFVPMSSKAYDYPVNDHTPRLRFRALLVCDVMAGCKYHKYERDQNFHLPEPYHSVYGNTRKYFIFSTEFDSAELAVYKAEAIMPRYVLICENLRPA